MNVVLFHRQATDDQHRYMQQLHRLLTAHGVHPTICADDQSLPDDAIDLVISIGGDGTLLNAVHHIGGRDIPVVGINFGHLGFLTAIGRTVDASRFVDDLLAGHTTIEPRTMLCASIEGNRDEVVHYCLNEVTVHRSNGVNTLSTHLYVDDRYVATYTGDGVIVATPTGSTAYSLSCGGPVLTPDCGCFVVTPIAPHTMTLRSIIVPDTSVIRLLTNVEQPSFSLGVDAESIEMPSGTVIHITKAPFNVRLIRMADQSFFTAIQEKLSWGK